MVAPNTNQTVLQAGKESAAGTLVAATHVVDHVPGTASLKRAIKKIYVSQAGSFAGRHRSYNGAETVDIDYTATATYDRLPTLAGLFLQPVATGTGNPAATWTYSSLNDTTDDLYSYSFELGGVNYPSAYTIAGVRGKTWDIHIEQDKAWEMKVGLQGMITTAGSLTGALSLPSNALQDVLGTQTKVYIDTTTVGSTQVVGTVVSADVKIAIGTDPRHTLDALATPYRIGLVKSRDISAKLVIEYAAQTEYTAWAANTTRKVRLLATGPTLGATNYKAQVDLYGVWDAHTLGNDNGVVTLELDLMGVKDATAGAEINALFITGLTALP